jgi:hypothetical protein
LLISIQGFNLRMLRGFASFLRLTLGKGGLRTYADCGGMARRCARDYRFREGRTNQISLYNSSNWDCNPCGRVLIFADSRNTAH